MIGYNLNEQVEPCFRTRASQSLNKLSLKSEPRLVPATPLASIIVGTSFFTAKSRCQQATPGILQIPAYPSFQEIINYKRYIWIRNLIWESEKNFSHLLFSRHHRRLSRLQHLVRDCGLRLRGQGGFEVSLISFGADGQWEIILMDPENGLILSDGVHFTEGSLLHLSTPN